MSPLPHTDCPILEPHYQVILPAASHSLLSSGVHSFTLLSCRPSDEWLNKACVPPPPPQSNPHLSSLPGSLPPLAQGICLTFLPSSSERKPALSLSHSTHVGWDPAPKPEEEVRATNPHFWGLPHLGVRMALVSQWHHYSCHLPNEHHSHLAAL